MAPASEPREIPLFPLPGVVLFPTLSVPLYVFEPRYRAMTHAALVTHRRIGMVAIRPEALGAAVGDPAIFAVGCEGEITRAQQRPDGTLDLLLAATRRFEIVDELPDSAPYRSARIAPLHDEAWTPGAPEIVSARRQIVAALVALSGRDESPASEKGEADPLWAPLEDLPDERFVHAVAQAADLAVLEKQRLLEAPGVAARYRLLEAFLGFRAASSGAPVAPGSETLQ